MFDRTSGLNILVDEISVPPENWSVAPRYVSFALTNSCGGVGQLVEKHLSIIDAAS
jgi:hypothetical protein